MSYERLIAEHGRIDMALGRLQRLIDEDLPDSLAVVIGLSDLSRELSAHLAFEDSFIYPRMIASANPQASATAQEFIEDFAQLGQDWRVYQGEWNAECIAADWAEFRHQTRAMIARLAERGRAENQLLYAAALQAGAIRLRKAA
jgi:iron-sulfur cluster repair protein YtfE (RIC family)